MSKLIFEKVWEDTSWGVFQINCIASSDNITATMKTYVTPRTINELSENLIRFPKNINDTFLWRTSERGSGTTPDLEINAFCKDKSGHIRIEIFMEIDDNSEYNCSFFMDNIEAEQLNSFAKKLFALNSGDIGTRIEIST